MRNIKRSRTSRTSTPLVAVCLCLLLAGGAAAGDAYLGIAVSGLSSGMSRALKLEEGVGVLVDRVVIGSPAEQAGLQSGDVILAIEEVEIAGGRDLTRHLRELDPGESVQLIILREGKQRKLKAVLGERPQRKVDGRAGIFDGKEYWNWFDGEGKEIQLDFQEHLARLTSGYLGVVLQEGRQDRDERPGAAIASVSPGSPAAAAGLQEGDMIVRLDDEDIVDEAALQKQLQRTRSGDTVRLRVVRDGESREVEAVLAGMAERLGLADLIQSLKPRDPSAPSYHHRPFPGLDGLVDRGQLHVDRENLDELRKELAELKEQLSKLREELGQDR